MPIQSPIWNSKGRKLFPHNLNFKSKLVSNRYVSLYQYRTCPISHNLFAKSNFPRTFFLVYVEIYDYLTGAYIILYVVGRYVKFKEEEVDWLTKSNKGNITISYIFFSSLSNSHSKRDFAISLYFNLIHGNIKSNFYSIYSFPPLQHQNLTLFKAYCIIIEWKKEEKKNVPIQFSKLFRRILYLKHEKFVNLQKSALSCFIRFIRNTKHNESQVFFLTFWCYSIFTWKMVYGKNWKILFRRTCMWQALFEWKRKDFFFRLL